MAFVIGALESLMMMKQILVKFQPVNLHVMAPILTFSSSRINEWMSLVKTNGNVELIYLVFQLGKFLYMIFLTQGIIWPKSSMMILFHLFQNIFSPRILSRQMLKMVVYLNVVKVKYMIYKQKLFSNYNSKIAIFSSNKVWAVKPCKSVTF